ncbi:MAG: ORF6C domain-containing protein [Culicoidibacterales bacterium]
MELTNLNNGTITTLELVEQINLFRKQYDNKSELLHKTMLEIVRDEFEEEILTAEIIAVKYTNSRGREYDMYELTPSQAKQVLVRESKSVRKAVIAYVEKLEAKVKQEIPTNPMDFLKVMFAVVDQQQTAVNEIAKDVNYLKKEVRIESSEKAALDRQISKRVYQVINDNMLYTDTEIVKMLFAEIGNDVKRITGVNTRTQIKAHQFNGVYNFILSWEPSNTTLLMARQIVERESEKY